jgi:hypothetical protein
LFIGGLHGLAEELPVQLTLLVICITDEYTIARLQKTQKSRMDHNCRHPLLVELEDKIFLRHVRK